MSTGSLCSGCKTVVCNHDFVIETDETTEKACLLKVHILHGLKHKSDPPQIQQVAQTSGSCGNHPACVCSFLYDTSIEQDVSIGVEVRMRGKVTR